MAEVFVSNLNESAREKSITLLKDRLAESLDLTLAVKQAHWTIKGPSFIGLIGHIEKCSQKIRIFSGKFLCYGDNIERSDACFNLLF